MQSLDELRKNKVNVDVRPEYIEVLAAYIDMDTVGGPAGFVEHLIMNYLREEAWDCYGSKGLYHQD
jgi:hypothetical protein